MAGIDDVLERLITDDAFRAELATDPDTALTGYDLTDDDRTLLVSQLSSDAGRAGRLEGRTSKAGMFGLLGGLDEIADAIAASDGGATIQPAQSDFEFVAGRADDDAAAAKGSHRGEIDVQAVNWGAGQHATDDQLEVEVTVEADESDEPSAQADATGYEYPGDYARPHGGVTPAEKPDDFMPQPATPAASGGTMSTDTWDAPTAGDEGHGEKITIHGQYDTHDAPPPNEETTHAPGADPDNATPWTAIATAESGGSTTNPIGEGSKGLWQINVDPDSATPATDAQQAAGTPKLAEYAIHGNSPSPDAVDDLLEAEPPPERGADAPMSYQNSFEAIPSQAPVPEVGEVGSQPDSTPDGAHVAISLGDGQPGADDPDPDAFDVSELTQWAAHQSDTGAGPADLGAAPDTGSGGAVPDQGVAEPPTPDR